METWGLPISEFKKYRKPIFAADLPYAHETVGDYENVYWFNPQETSSLINAIKKWLDGVAPDGSKINNINHTCYNSWDDLLKMMLK